MRDSLDPAAVMTVAELARQLALLRITAPRPTPAHEPLTLRELSEITGVPRSTLGNAESGRILPGAGVVHKFAEGCQVPREQLALWTEARNRVAHAARYQRARPRPPAVAGIEDELTADERAPVQAAVDFLQAQGIVASRADLDQALDGMPAAQCATYLTAMPPAVAAACLNVMSLPHGASCLHQAPTATAVTMLRHEDVAIAAEHLQLLPEAALRRILAAMPPPACGRILASMPRHEAYALVAALPTAWACDLIADDAVSCSLAADLFFRIGHEHSDELVATLKASRLAGLLTAMDPDPAAGVLDQLPEPRSRRTLAAMPATQAAYILSHLPPPRITALVRTVPDSRAADLMAGMPPRLAATVLWQLGQDRREAVVGALSDESRKRVEEVLPRARADVRTWLPAR